jgi:transcriptional regulator with XRE-family HTH domain
MGHMTANPGEPQTSAPPTPHGRIPADTFSNRLLLARALAGHLSIREACERTGLNRGNWQDWERGRRPRDQVEVSQTIAEALDIDFNWLLLGGPLLGARGRPTKRLDANTDGYRCPPSGPPRSTTRPSPNRPKVRTDPQRPISPARPGRRANRVDLPLTVEALHSA